MASYVRASVTADASYRSATSNARRRLEGRDTLSSTPPARSRGLGRRRRLVPRQGTNAAVTDAQAAVRYLRLNDAAMPGSAERIVVNGTSGGGALAGPILGACR
ncbi:Tannase OS=Streptomyces fumanus OX=67302 GN=tanL PE=4 SV=1 [Streptomyces fumanus]